ncbi:hypothetical protein [Streptomyces canus]|uniref:hypothetical protein n=1 Tax=Streptomyces canus TaxID=58343 RepID=UPI002DDB56B2|nr:hypothetical protein [Streptomyces canus]WSD92717.1 hypothetical protein OG925_51615 [Streptomyces canus]
MQSPDHHRHEAVYRNGVFFRRRNLLAHADAATTMEHLTAVEPKHALEDIAEQMEPADRAWVGPARTSSSEDFAACKTTTIAVRRRLQAPGLWLVQHPCSYTTASEAGTSL